jgi:SF-assemblin/beta giardin
MADQDDADQVDDWNDDFFDQNDDEIFDGDVVAAEEVIADSNHVQHVEAQGGETNHAVEENKDHSASSSSVSAGYTSTEYPEEGDESESHVAHHPTVTFQEDPEKTVHTRNTSVAFSEAPATTVAPIAANEPDSQVEEPSAHALLSSVLSPVPPRAETVAEMLSSFTALKASSPEISSSMVTTMPSDSTAVSTTLALLHPSSFEDLIREKTMKRRQKQNTTIASLQVQVERLEAALLAETKRRTAAFQQVQESCAKELQLAVQSMQTQLTQDAETFAARYQQVESQLGQLEGKWQHDVTKIEEEWNTATTELEREIHEISHTNSREHTSRQVRQEQLLQQIQQLSQRYELQWRQERSERMTAVQEVSQKQEQAERTRQTQVTAYHNALQQELHLLQQELQQEQSVRQQADDTIVEALNQYTIQLQKSLALIVSSDD